MDVYIVLQLQHLNGRIIFQLQHPHGRTVLQLQHPNGRIVLQLQHPNGRTVLQLQHPNGRTVLQLQHPNGCIVTVLTRATEANPRELAPFRTKGGYGSWPPWVPLEHLSLLYQNCPYISRGPELYKSSVTIA